MMSLEEIQKVHTTFMSPITTDAMEAPVLIRVVENDLRTKEQFEGRKIYCNNDLNTMFGRLHLYQTFAKDPLSPNIEIHVADRKNTEDAKTAMAIAMAAANKSCRENPAIVNNSKRASEKEMIKFFQDFYNTNPARLKPDNELLGKFLRNSKDPSLGLSAHLLEILESLVLPKPAPARGAARPVAAPRVPVANRQPVAAPNPPPAPGPDPLLIFWGNWGFGMQVPIQQPAPLPVPPEVAAALARRRGR